MTHTSKAGEPKILSECDLPLTGKGVANITITELAERPALLSRCLRTCVSCSSRQRSNSVLDGV